MSTIEIADFDVQGLALSSGAWNHDFGGFGILAPDIAKARAHLGFYSSTLIPLWLPLLLTAIPTAWLWHRDRRSQRIRPGRCLRCGYDLTGNTSGVCSECGTKIDAAQPAALEPQQGRA